MCKLRCAQDGETALMKAAKNGHVNLVRGLMNSSWAGIDAEDAVGDPTMVTLYIYIYIFRFICI